MTLHGGGSAPRPVGRLRSAGRAFRENRPVFTAVNGLDELAEGDPVESRAKARAAVANPDVRALMAVPIRVGDQRLGVLEVMSYRAGAFTREDGATLTLLAEQCAIALRNARLIEELQRSNRLKDDFLANLSHEVRTPLTGIVGWAEVLLDSHGGDPPVKRALEAILGQSETLSRMLADLIDLSRIDNFGLELRRERVRLSETIAGALDAVAPGAAKRGVAIRCHIERDLPAMEGDPARLKQVVWNLLANGVKFSPTGGTVEVTVARTGDGGLELAVADAGPRDRPGLPSARLRALPAGGDLLEPALRGPRRRPLDRARHRGGARRDDRRRERRPREGEPVPRHFPARARRRAGRPRDGARGAGGEPGPALSRGAPPSGRGAHRGAQPDRDRALGRARPREAPRDDPHGVAPLLRVRGGLPLPRRGRARRRTAAPLQARAERRRLVRLQGTHRARRRGEPRGLGRRPRRSARPRGRVRDPEGRPVPPQRRLRRRDRVPDARDARRPHEGPSRGPRRRPPAHEPARARRPGAVSRRTSSRSSSPSRRRRPSA